MKRLSWLRSLITIGLLGFIGVQSGCAGWLPPLARTVLIDSRAALSGATHAMDTRELPLSDQAELYLYPRQLWLQGDSLVARAHEGRLRLQVIVRVIRADGGVIQWFVGARRDAPTSEGGFEVALEGDKATVDFGGMRLGPVRAADVIGLQLFVTLMPREPIQTVHFVGAAGLPLDAGRLDDPEMAKLAGATFAAQSAPALIAKHVTLVAEAERTRSEVIQLTWMSGPGLAGNREAGVPLSWAEGRHAEGALLSRFRMQVEAMVETHEEERQAE